MTRSLEPLRRDVSYLGKLLGDTLVEQEGADLLDLEEQIRALAKERRSHSQPSIAAKKMESLIASFDTATAERVARAFTHYFSLVNLAEQHHRVRRRRDHARAGEPQLGSLIDVLTQRIKSVSSDRIADALAKLEIELVFTAHPTEAQRRTVSDKHRRVAALLARRDRTDLTPSENEQIETALREEIATLWQTDEIRQERPRVGDEVKSVLFYLEEILYPLVPKFYAEIEAVIHEHYGSEIAIPSFLKFGSWVGADMDGNPNVTPDVAVDTALAQASRVVGLHLRALSSLGEALSQSARLVGVTDELRESITRDAERMPTESAIIDQHTQSEPYRRKLSLMSARLNATRDGFQRARESAWKPNEASRTERLKYQNAAEFIGDLAAIERSLEAHRGARAGLVQVRDLKRQVSVFGFHLARLDIRVPAQWVRDSVRAALWLDQSAPLNSDVLHRALMDPRVPPRPDLPGMLAMAALARMRTATGTEGSETFILSMAHGRDDLLATLVLARIAGIYRPDDGIAGISVVPLFETLADLQRSAGEMQLAFDDSVYAKYLSVRAQRQEVMIGYSDSNKDAGILGSSFALYRAQRELVDVSTRAKITLKIFHGRGGSIGRGGGPSQRAIASLPPGSINGKFKLTEQGEVIAWKYLVPEIALRNLELTAAGVLGSTLHSNYPPADELAKYESMFDQVAIRSVESYRRLVTDRDFPAYFEGSTPLAEISLMPLGSRPARRTGQARIDDLRAIPWVFAWTQSRQMVPGWFGAGAGLNWLLRTHGLENARNMREKWPFFATLLDAVAVSLATTDMDIARRYAALADNCTRSGIIFIKIALDHARALRAIRLIFGQPTVLSHQPTLEKSIELRNPYVDPLSFIQVELLRRKHALLKQGHAVPPELDRAILITINGIASGLRNTG